MVCRYTLLIFNDTDRYFLISNSVTGQGADVNTKSSGGVPILCLAAKNKHFGTFRVLANKGADINCVVPSTKDSPLHIAVQQGSQDIVKFLVKQGADFMQPNIQVRGDDVIVT